MSNVRAQEPVSTLATYVIEVLFIVNPSPIQLSSNVLTAD